ncbi:hypothetical protein HDV03_003130 [Kappamyces sp. JEL0829]|nr:hypothetical protein HDV03_003130 [Kappamyces sp. JEL0829]
MTDPTLELIVLYIDGTLGVPYTVSTPFRVFVLAVQIAVLLLSFTTLGAIHAFAIFKNPLLSKIDVILVTNIVAQSFNLAHLYSLVPPLWIQWISYLFTTLLCLLVSLLNMEILISFSIISKFWTVGKVRYFQVIWIVLYTLLFVMWEYWGFVSILILTTIYVTLQALYLCGLIVSFLSKRKSNMINQKQNHKLRRFIKLTLAVSALDWVGLFLYAAGGLLNDFFATAALGGCQISLHSCLFTVFFKELGRIALQGNQPRREVIAETTVPSTASPSHEDT